MKLRHLGLFSIDLQLLIKKLFKIIIINIKYRLFIYDSNISQVAFIQSSLRYNQFAQTANSKERL